MMKFLGRMVAEIVPDRYRKSAYDIHPGANHFLDLVEQERYEELTEQFLPVARSEKALLVEAISEIIGQDDFFDYWTTLQSSSAFAHLMRGALLVVRAVFYRGGGLGSELSDVAVAKMLQALRSAIPSLDQARKDPVLGQEATAWMIRGTMTNEYNWDFRHDLLKDLRQPSDPHLTGELRYQLASCEKWFGSHEDMFRHARNARVRYPHHPEIGALIAAAHYERHMYYDRFDRDHAAARDYFRSADVLDEIRSASDRILSTPPTSPLDFIQAHNVFAAVFCEAGCFDLAGPHFIGMDNRILAYPWAYHDEGTLQRWYNRAIRS